MQQKQYVMFLPDNLIKQQTMLLTRVRLPGNFNMMQIIIPDLRIIRLYLL
jgi:hypothetical protein